MKGNSPAGNFTPIPEGFLNRMQSFLEADYNSFAESLRLQATSGLRANSFKVFPDKLLEMMPVELSPLPWCRTGFWLPAAEELPADFYLGKHPYHAAGLYYLQEPTAMAVVEMLDPQPGERVLDLAAAPGGKATHIVSRMGNSGLLVANDVHSQRVWELAENLERWGARNTIIFNETPERLAGQFPGFFDRVLLDAPCSGEGMFRKSDSARRDWSPGLVHSCASRQRTIIEQAAKLVRPGGTIVYSTCTFAPEENEAVIGGFMQDHPDFQIHLPPNLQGYSRGHPEWTGPLPGSIADQLENTIRLWPHQLQGEGHFIARLDHTGGRSGSRRGTHKNPRLPDDCKRAFAEFNQAALKDRLDSDRLFVEGSYLYQPPDHLPDISGLRVIHPGLWIGTFKKGSRDGDIRFEPAHALALTIRAEQAAHICALNYEQALGYLKGASLPDSGVDGWTAITFDEFPIGWGKRSRGVIKNYYPKGLRWV